MSATDSDIQKAVALLTRGDLVVIPTETVYGLAANATNSAAVEKIFFLKGRPPTNPLICHVATLDQAYSLIADDADPQVKDDIKTLSHLWPGPLTLVVPKNEVIPSIVTAGGNTVAIRIPNHPIALEILKKIPFPLAAPSANRSNYISPTTAEHVRREFKGDAPLIIDGGACKVGLESTVLSLENAALPIILRAGAISKETIEKALQRPVQLFSKSIKAQSPRTSPGLMSTHYSPKTKLQLLSTYDFSSSFLTRVGLIAFDAAVAKDYDFTAIEILSENRNLRSVAQRLYDSLRTLDGFDLELILVDECEPIGIGAAIMDRISRALSK